MISISFNLLNIKPIPSKKHDFLIANKDTALACCVYKKLITSTLNLNPSILQENKHYLNKKEKRYWTKKGIVRLCLLLDTNEALGFATIIEDYSLQNIPNEKLKKLKSELNKLHCFYNNLKVLSESNSVLKEYLPYFEKRYLKMNEVFL